MVFMSLLSAQKAQEGLIAELSSDQRTEAYGAEEDGSLVRAREVSVVYRKHAISSYFFPKVRFIPTAYIPCTSRKGCAGSKSFGKIKMKVFL